MVKCTEEGSHDEPGNREGRQAPKRYSAGAPPMTQDFLLDPTSRGSTLPTTLGIEH